MAVLKCPSIPNVTNFFPEENAAPTITLGKFSYVNGATFEEYLTKNSHVLIGNFCSISWNIFFLLGQNHDYRRVSTFPISSINPVNKLPPV